MDIHPSSFAVQSVSLKPARLVVCIYLVFESGGVPVSLYRPSNLSPFTRELDVLLRLAVGHPSTILSGAHALLGPTQEVEAGDRQFARKGSGLVFSKLHEMAPAGGCPL